MAAALMTLGRNPHIPALHGAAELRTKRVASPIGSGSSTAMLDSERSERRVSTGLAALDAVLGGLYRGDNVVWDLDGASVQPFYDAIAQRADAFDNRAVVWIGDGETG